MTAKVDEQVEQAEPEERARPNLQRIELGGALAGHNVVIDVDEVTPGFLEDIQRGWMPGLLDGFAEVILASDLIPAHPDGSPTTSADVRAWIRGLKRPQFVELSGAIQLSMTTVPKGR